MCHHFPFLLMPGSLCPLISLLSMPTILPFLCIRGSVCSPYTPCPVLRVLFIRHVMPPYTIVPHFPSHSRVSMCPHSTFPPCPYFSLPLMPLFPFLPISGSPFSVRVSMYLPHFPLPLHRPYFFSFCQGCKSFRVQHLLPVLGVSAELRWVSSISSF